MITELLRHPAEIAERCRNPAAQRDVARHNLLLIAAGGALFGAVVGTFRGGAQIGISAVKIPIATLMTLAISGPGLAAFAVAFGRSWTLRETLSYLLSAGARSSLVLFALSPVLWLVIDLQASYSAIRLAATASYALAGLSGFLLLLRGLGPAPGRAPVAACFVLLFLVVGGQSAWLLRPYLGNPGERQVPFFSQGRQQGGLVETLGRSVF
jgi:hypothetical protein